MRPSIALRANCATWLCALCRLPNTSPESASKACRAPATAWLSTAMINGLDSGPLSSAVATAAGSVSAPPWQIRIRTARERPLCHHLSCRHPDRLRPGHRCHPLPLPASGYIVGGIAERRREKGQIACDTAERGAAQSHRLRVNIVYAAGRGAKVPRQHIDGAAGQCCAAGKASLSFCPAASVLTRKNEPAGN